MKHIKTYEAINRPPKIGDYVIIDIPDYNTYRKTYLDVINTIGQITEIKIQHGGSNLYYVVKFDIIEGNKEFGGGAFSDKGETSFLLKNFEFWSEDKDELETKLSAKKYNL